MKYNWAQLHQWRQNGTTRNEATLESGGSWPNVSLHDLLFSLFTKHNSTYTLLSKHCIAHIFAAAGLFALNYIVKNIHDENRSIQAPVRVFPSAYSDRSSFVDWQYDFGHERTISGCARPISLVKKFWSIFDWLWAFESQFRFSLPLQSTWAEYLQHL